MFHTTKTLMTELVKAFFSLKTAAELFSTVI